MSPSAPFAFSTKAGTLQNLLGKTKLATIPRFSFFTVAQWAENPLQITETISKQFLGAKVAIRSSALLEDSATGSMAGAFLSHLHVASDSPEKLGTAINTVIQSYNGHSNDQVLVQEMVSGTSASGVITTYVVADGAPYYVINYDDESGRTDTITGGKGVNKTVLIHRDATTDMIQSRRVVRWLEMAKELETLCGRYALDIEFAQGNDERLYILQVRRIATAHEWKKSVAETVSAVKKPIECFINERFKKRPGILGTKTTLGEMPDWNPAEIIGTSPRPLAITLYRNLVTDSIWREARSLMGYRNPENEALLTSIGGRPFIDVRNSFNSFLPASLPDPIAEVLVDAWIARLDNHPELHDKVEFEIAQTVLDFNFDKFFVERYPGILSYSDRDSFKSHLRRLTVEALNLGDKGTLPQALSQISKLRSRQRARQNHPDLILTDKLARASHLLSECRTLGTLPFSIIARHAFIAESFLRSAVVRNALSLERVNELKLSIETVAKKMSADLARVARGEIDKSLFLAEYGHLRPGTYDILSLRYDQRNGLFDNTTTLKASELISPFDLSPNESRLLQALLKESGLDNYTPEHLLQYARIAIPEREAAKFVFTKNLSDALELLAAWGMERGLSRDDLSYLPLNEVLRGISEPWLKDEGNHFKTLSNEGRKDAELCRTLRLSYLIRDKRDIYVVPLHRSAPNFVTCKQVEGATVFVNSRMLSTPDLNGKIVCIENADPGFDWIFSRNISGLITKFGGSNSHMAIRCAEFGLPAAIGCGEQTFDRVISNPLVDLNCADKIIRPFHA